MWLIIWKFISAHYLKIFIVLAVLGTVWAVLAWRKADISHWKSEGRAACVKEYEDAQVKADAETRKKQIYIRQNTEKRKAKFHDQKDDAYVGSLLQRYYDGMRRAD
jgi:hypothetical protein